GNLPPVATFAATPSGFSTASGFDATGSFDPGMNGGIATYVWDWGDATALGATALPTHVYAAAGSYIACLTVTDNGLDEFGTAGLAKTATSCQTIIIP
ncbi:MAG: PKD domain-containing protein, partial [Mariprofundaceae bacterium]